MQQNSHYDAIVVGAGHAGVEAALALARLNKTTLLLTLSLDAIAFMACNPNIGGTAKGHLVREVDALGGQIGLSADSSLLQLRMLNMSKGAAVHSLRGQEDKILYHHNMKQIIENEPNITLLQGEVSEILTHADKVIGITTTLGSAYYSDAVVICTGVYLKSDIIIGDYRKPEGPGGFSRAEGLTDSLLNLGITIRRFKTGTPARVHKDSIDFSQLIRQDGDENIYPFSFMNDTYQTKNSPCYLTYTNEHTHEIIRSNIHRSPLYNGSIKSVGPRYCPSIEDKVMRFADKDKHQIFIEPESELTKEMYIQGMSSSLPHDVQLEMYRSIKGLENCRIMRYAYAIEYDCIDSTQLSPSLMLKHVSGLFTAGQINGSSGYEEAAAQGLMAGINASRYIDNLPPVILRRDQAYIGVLIDDLVTKGTNEPYRMMTARAEYRLQLRQENADIRLTQIGRDIGLVSDERYERYLTKKASVEEYFNLLSKTQSPKVYGGLFTNIGEPVPEGGLTYKDLLRRNVFSPDEIKDYFDELRPLNKRYYDEAVTLVKYEGYLSKQQASIREMNKLENSPLPSDLDYNTLSGLRLEARAKLNTIRPTNLAQASRISGVSPADITVLMVHLFKRKGGNDE